MPSNTEIFRSLAMPLSSITPEMWESQSGSFIDEVQRGSGWVGKDGTLFLDIPFAQFDVGWATSGICYLFKELGIIKTHKFGNTPASISISEKESLKIVIIGDWGTGMWRDGKYNTPSKLISDAIKSLTPGSDISIHLGDVYYSGLKSQESRNLLTEYPTGSDFNFTLNSNHEMYSGSQGYYKTALSNKLFHKQQGTSFFSIKFKDWVILGLDSSYFDKSFMVKDGALFDKNSIQQDFIKSLNIPNSQKILLLTHHHGMDYTGMHINPLLVSHVYSVLGNFYPDYWYYGHLHNGVVYNEKSIIGGEQYKTRSNTHPRLRCVGNSAIPYGKALLDNNPGIEYFSKTPLPNPDKKQKLRVLNGFAVITLSAGTITEEFYDVSPATGAILQWKA